MLMLMLVSTVDLNFSAWTLMELVALGLAAGLLGGMLGVGGSVIMIPGLTFLLGPQQHLYQASAMIVNVLVSVPALRRHLKARAVVGPALRWLLPATLVMVLVGVWASNLLVFQGPEGGIVLGRVLAVFLLYVIGVNLRKLITGSDAKPASASTDATVAASGDENAAGGGEKVNEIGTARASPGASAASSPAAVTRDQAATDARASGSVAPAGAAIGPGRCSAVGSVMGFIAGLLGIGGGAIAVPLQQVMLRLPLRNCIANSAAVICISATIGSIYKNLTLQQHGYDWSQSLFLAAVLAPTAIIGGYLGGALTHILPIRTVRGVFVLLMIAAAWRMAAIPMPWG